MKLKKDYIYYNAVDDECFVVLGKNETETKDMFPIKVLNLSGKDKNKINNWKAYVEVECIGHKDDYPEYYI